MGVFVLSFRVNDDDDDDYDYTKRDASIILIHTSVHLNSVPSRTIANLVGLSRAPQELDPNTHVNVRCVDAHRPSRVFKHLAN